MAVLLETKLLNIFIKVLACILGSGLVLTSPDTEHTFQITSMVNKRKKFNKQGTDNLTIANIKIIIIC